MSGVVTNNCVLGSRIWELLIESIGTFIVTFSKFTCTDAIPDSTGLPQDQGREYSFLDHLKKQQYWELVKKLSN